MRTAKVMVLPYDTEWKNDFEKIKKEIEDAIGELITGIEHVGSTSVEGIKRCFKQQSKEGYHMLYL